MTKGVAIVTGENDPQLAGWVRHRKNKHLLSAARVERGESEPAPAGGRLSGPHKTSHSGTNKPAG